MLLSALALAAALQAAPAATAAFVQQPKIEGQRSALECRRPVTQTRQADSAQAGPLNRMPMATLQHTVVRMVDGCPVSTRVIQYRPAR